MLVSNLVERMNILLHHPALSLPCSLRHVTESVVWVRSVVTVGPRTLRCPARAVTSQGHVCIDTCMLVCASESH